MNNQVILGDALTSLSQFPKQYFNSIITDIPYFVLKGVEWDNQWKSLNEYLSFFDKIFKEYKRIIKENGNLFIFTGRQYNRHICILLDKYFIEQRIIIWCRKRWNETRGKALSSGYEPICFYSNSSDFTFNNIKIKVESDRKEYTTGILKDGINLSDVWNDIPAIPHNSKERIKEHPSQKPINLIKRILEIGTNENDIVLDNFAGTGTLGDACLDMNRQFIMIDNNEEYIDIINKKINSNKTKNELFEFI